MPKYNVLYIMPLFIRNKSDFYVIMCYSEQNCDKIFINR